MISIFLWICGGGFLFVWIYRAVRAVKSLRELPLLIPSQAGEPASAPSFVSVIVPMRNEASNVAELMEPLLRQDYPSYEVIVVNNGSTDKTAELLKKYDDKILVLEANHTPEGWTGKNYALSIGSGAAKGEWFLFLDADTRHKPASIRTAVTYAEQNGASFLTALPECLAGDFWEHLIQPTAMSFIGLWFPIKKINDPDSPLAFANGQYLLIHRELYQKIGGHREVRKDFLEDFALMRKTKEVGAKAVCALGVEIYGTRMYESVPAIWRGWCRIFLHAFQSRPDVLLVKALGLLFFTTLPYVVFFLLVVSLAMGKNVSPWLVGLFLGILGLATSTACKAFSIVRARRRYSLLLPLGSLILAAIIGHAAWIAFRKQPTRWR